LHLDRVIAFDMGGTTAKAGLILNGQMRYAMEYEVGGEIHRGGLERGNGYPLKFPMIDVAECGAGAGSIAWIDPGGHLKVGPQSAGAVPGPACYGQGGQKPTVTDAQLILGRLDPNSFLGGEMALYPELARKAVAGHLCKPLGMSVEEAAHGILTVANVKMLRILRVVSVARGYDPRDFTLIAYGGAGPLHAVDLAEAMSIRRVVIPRWPGLFSALGLLYADTTTDFVQTVMVPLAEEHRELLNATLNRLCAKAEEWFNRSDVPPESRRISVSADLRYLRQNYELTVALPTSSLSRDDMLLVQSEFHQVHDTTYGHSAPEEIIQVVNLRLRAVGVLAKPQMQPIEWSSGLVSVALRGSRSVQFQGGLLHSNVYERSALRSGHRLEGPAIIQEKESTTLVGPGWHLEVDRFGNLIISADR
jgi:N-methylhydantoinase A